MIIKNNNIYLINIPKMKINQKYIFNNNSKIDFIYKIKKNIYIYINNNIFIFNYFHSEINLIQSINLNNSSPVNYFSNLLQKNLNNLKIKIKINWDENYQKFFILIIGKTGKGKSSLLNIF